VNVGRRGVFKVQADRAYAAGLNFERPITIIGGASNNSVEDRGCVEKLKAITAFVIAQNVVVDKHVMAAVLPANSAKPEGRDRRSATLNVFEAIV
jgi:hypothetical protein